MSAPVREGDILAGKYCIEKVLGVGGMGVVVAARHIDLDERVAIKFLLPETLGNSEAVARFAREARAAVKIKSEHVARVSDVGKLENGAPYMVMEFLEGGDLSAWLGQRGALPIEQAVEFVLQGCEAIAEAHALGIVHRDLKPANLFVIRRADGVLSVKVLDFGISKLTGLGGSDGAGSMTKTSAMMGSPLYMSPEQMQSSKNVDARGDIWALGVILYELVTGQTPFTADTMPELVLRIMTDAPAPMRNRRPDAPDGLEAVILRCLDKDRGKRFQTIGELAQALLPFGPRRAKASVERISGVMMAAGLSASALALPPSSDQQATVAGTAASWGRTADTKSRGPWIALGGVAALVLTGVIVMASRKPAGTGEAPSATPAATGAPAVTVAPPPPEAPAPTPEAPASAAASQKAPDAPPPSTTAAVAGKPEHAGHRLGQPTAPVAPAAQSIPPAVTPVAAPSPVPVAPPPAPPTPAVAKMPPAPAPAPAAAPASNPNCNPSFYFDSQGNKHFKPECFH
jgi:serine/threonine-protein kinase